MQVKPKFLVSRRLVYFMVGLFTFNQLLMSYRTYMIEMDLERAVVVFRGHEFVENARHENLSKGVHFDSMQLAEGFLEHHKIIVEELVLIQNIFKEILEHAEAQARTTHPPIERAQG